MERSLSTSSVVTGQKEESIECGVGPDMLGRGGILMLDISLRIVLILLLKWLAIC